MILMLHNLDFENGEYIQDGREISSIIVTDDYLCYMESKSPYKFFLLF